jgi:V/A-type H+-transporting ATPase subunit A
MLELIFTYEDEARRAIRAGADIEDICSLSVHERIGRAKTVPNDRYLPEFESIRSEIKSQMNRLIEIARESED